MSRAVAIAAIVGITACGAAAAGGAAGTTPLTVQTSVVGSRPLTVGRRLDLVVEAQGTGIKPASLSVAVDPRPLSPLAPPRLTRTVRDGLVIVHLVQPVACLDNRCAPNRDGAHTALVRGARARAVTIGGGSLSARSPDVAVRFVPVVPAAAVRKGAYRAEVTLPAPDLRASPRWLAVLLYAIAVALGACSIVLVRAELRRRSPRPPGVAADPLDRAIRLTRESVSREPNDRRRAVGLLARVLAREREELAIAATRLAWARPEPEPDPTLSLADCAAEPGESR